MAACRVRVYIDGFNLYYGALKALCEKAAGQAMPGRVAVVRPGYIVGPDDPTGRFTYWPVRIDRGGEVLAIEHPKSMSACAHGGEHRVG